MSAAYKLILELCLVDIFEDIFKATIVSFQNSVLS